MKKILRFFVQTLWQHCAPYVNQLFPHNTTPFTTRNEGMKFTLPLSLFSPRTEPSLRPTLANASPAATMIINPPFRRSGRRPGQGCALFSKAVKQHLLLKKIQNTQENCALYFLRIKKEGKLGSSIPPASREKKTIYTTKRVPSWRVGRRERSHFPPTFACGGGNPCSLDPALCMEHQQLLSLRKDKENKHTSTSLTFFHKKY